MKNIRFLKYRSEAFEATKYAVFFEHDGFSARLDWSIDDSVDVTEDQIQNLMLEQMALDLATDWLIEDIKSKQSDESHNVDKNVQRFLNDGFVEEDALEFKVRAMARFGNE